MSLTSALHLGHDLADPIPVRRISGADLQEALRKGFQDFMAMPSHLLFLGLIYPIAGIFFAALAFGYDVMPLLFPLASGFALVGPLAGIGLYELSRRREAGLEPKWREAFAVLQSPGIGAIVAMGAILLVIFVAWLFAAQMIFSATMGEMRSDSHVQLLGDILTTGRGWALIVIGNLVGFAFAALVLTTSVIAFPMILDRHCTVVQAIDTSRRAVLMNPVTMATWGLIVAVLLALASIPLFVGLAVAMPILGHATWHLYRRLVPA